MARMLQNQVTFYAMPLMAKMNNEAINHFRFATSNDDASNKGGLTGERGNIPSLTSRKDTAAALHECSVALRFQRILAFDLIYADLRFHVTMSPNDPEKLSMS
jgi:hypothetical protein